MQVGWRYSWRVGDIWEYLSFKCIHTDNFISETKILNPQWTTYKLVRNGFFLMELKVEYILYSNKFLNKNISKRSTNEALNGHLNLTFHNFILKNYINYTSISSMTNDKHYGYQSPTIYFLHKFLKGTSLKFLDTSKQKYSRTGLA